MNYIYGFIYIFAAWKWGDWRNWRLYYPTILFFVNGDLLYHFLLFDHFPLWRFNPVSIDEKNGITSVHISLIIMMIKYPCTILIYLGNFPKGKLSKQFLYITFWVMIYATNEIITHLLGGIKHYNGWNEWWSISFDVVMFSVLALHHYKPVISWILSFIYIIVLWNLFDVPSTVFR
ncbi:CBO0543 family protein [Metabacillus litoralis]|uniref:CBO0543 family protein n=1 Tax=Metabacillus litoralis TaxID=152268 RepID=UPI001CFCBCA9|nr:CBO0543 family protein [Metabacillus litoralis]